MCFRKKAEKQPYRRSDRQELPFPKTKHRLGIASTRRSFKGEREDPEDERQDTESEVGRVVVSGTDSASSWVQAMSDHSRIDGGSSAALLALLSAVCMAFGCSSLPAQSDNALAEKFVSQELPPRICSEEGCDYLVDALSDSEVLLTLDPSFVLVSGYEAAPLDQELRSQLEVYQAPLRGLTRDALQTLENARYFVGRLANAVAVGYALPSRACNVTPAELAERKVSALLRLACDQAWKASAAPNCQAEIRIDEYASFEEWMVGISGRPLHPVATFIFPGRLPPLPNRRRQPPGRGLPGNDERATVRTIEEVGKARSYDQALTSAETLVNAYISEEGCGRPALVVGASENQKYLCNQLGNVKPGKPGLSFEKVVLSSLRTPYPRFHKILTEAAKQWARTQQAKPSWSMVACAEKGAVLGLLDFCNAESEEDVARVLCAIQSWETRGKYTDREAQGTSRRPVSACAKCCVFFEVLLDLLRRHGREDNEECPGFGILQRELDDGRANGCVTAS